MAEPQRPDLSSAPHVTWPGQNAGELRVWMRDMVAFSSLRTLWTGREPRDIEESFAEALLSLLRLDLVFVQLECPPQGKRAPVLRTAAGIPPAERSRSIVETLGSRLNAESVVPTLRVPGLLDGRTLSLTVVPLGHLAEYGFLAAGSDAPGFPDDFQRALMSIGANQVAVALRERQIVERGRAELTLRESEEGFRSIFAHAAVGMSLQTIEGRYLHVNRACCQITGHTRAELLATDFQSITHPADLPKQQAQTDRMLSGEIPGFVIEKRFLRKGRDAVWVRSSLTLLRDAEGKPKNVVVLMEDITGRKVAEDALRDSERRFRAIFDGALDAMLLADDEGRYVGANPAACALLGRSRDLLLTESIANVSAPGMDYEQAWRALRREGHATGQWSLVRADGTIRDVEYQATANILPGLHLAILRDVTERKAVETEIANKSEMLLTIFDNVPCMFNVLGPGAHPLMVNREWTRAIGWTAQELEGRDLLELVYPDPDERRRARELIQASDRSWHDFRLRVKDGRTIDTSWANFRLSDGTMIGIGKDVTERKQAEEEREALLREVTAAHERLESLSRRLVNVQEEERRTIARELHDEVGQILTGLRLVLETKSRGTGLDLTEVTDLAAQISERVKDLSLSLRPPMLDDLGLVPTLLWHFEHYRTQTGVDVHFHHRGVGAARLPAGAEITAFRIVQEALTNVARHARVSEVSVELWTERGSLCLRVEDAGRGFDPTALSELSSGLTGMRERVLLAGGSLTVETKPGEGTRLLARLPLAAADAPAAGA